MDLSGLTPSQLKALQQQLGNVNPYSAAAGQGALDVAAGLGTLTGKYNTAVDPFVTGGQSLVRNAAGLPTRGSMLASNGLQRGVSRLAGSGAFKGALRAAPALGAVGGVLGVADVVAGNDSFANKAMDTAAMGIGGFLGSVGGPLGTAAGAGGGKMVSDGLQWLFGDKKTADQRKMEQALALLKAGVI